MEGVCFVQPQYMVYWDKLNLPFFCASLKENITFLRPVKLWDTCDFIIVDMM